MGTTQNPRQKQAGETEEVRKSGCWCQPKGPPDNDLPVPGTRPGLTDPPQVGGSLGIPRLELKGAGKVRGGVLLASKRPHDAPGQNQRRNVVRRAPDGDVGR